MHCTNCNIIILNLKKEKLWQFNRTGKVYCSKECTKLYTANVSRKNLIEINKKYASERMKRKNPCFNKETIEKIKNTKIKNGTLHKPPIIQGGNGKETPCPVKILCERLKWQLKYILRTGTRNFYPTHYKLEIANIEKKICIEIDSQVSYSRKDKAEKKENYLKSKGWITLRFKNKDVLNNLEYCIDKCLKLYHER